MSRLVRGGTRPDFNTVASGYINEPVGDTFRETFNRTTAHRAVNAPACDGQEELEHYYRTGRWV